MSRCAGWRNARLEHVRAGLPNPILAARVQRHAMAHARPPHNARLRPCRRHSSRSGGDAHRRSRSAPALRPRREDPATGRRCRFRWTGHDMITASMPHRQDRRPLSSRGTLRLRASSLRPVWPAASAHPLERFGQVVGGGEGKSRDDCPASEDVGIGRQHDGRHRSARRQPGDEDALRVNAIAFDHMLDHLADRARLARPRRASAGLNQLKHKLALLERFCSG